MRMGWRAWRPEMRVQTEWKFERRVVVRAGDGIVDGEGSVAMREDCW